MTTDSSLTGGGRRQCGSFDVSHSFALLVRGKHEGKYSVGGIPLPPLSTLCYTPDLQLCEHPPFYRMDHCISKSGHHSFAPPPLVGLMTLTFEGTAVT